MGGEGTSQSLSYGAGCWSMIDQLFTVDNYIELQVSIIIIPSVFGGLSEMPSFIKSRMSLDPC